VRERERRERDTERERGDAVDPFMRSQGVLLCARVFFIPT